MAQNPLMKRFLDAGVTFSSMTQARAEAIAKDLVKTGEVQAEQAQKFVDDLVSRSRQNTEKLRETVRSEVRKQMANLGLATKEDVDRLEKKIASMSKPAKKTATKKTATKKPAAKKTVKKSSK